jgi:hypothetical protein
MNMLLYQYHDIPVYTHVELLTRSSLKGNMDIPH